VSHASIFSAVEIRERNQSVANSRLCMGHLKRCSRPELVIEAIGQYGPSSIMVVLQVTDAVIESRQQGYGPLGLMYL
jgi:hypothetical protein